MTKRTELLKRIANAAKAADLDWKLDREGGNHTIFTLDGLPVPIARHRNLGERYAETVYKQCAGKLGKDWWKK